MTQELFQNNGVELRLKRDFDSFVYRASALIIHNGKLLMVASEELPNAFYTVGGAVNIHETAEEAIVREIYEEIGVRLEVERLAFIHELFVILNGKKYHQITFLFLMKSEPSLDIAEGSFTDQPPTETLHWLPMHDLQRYNIFPTFLKDRRLDSITALEHIVTKEY